MSYNLYIILYIIYYIILYYIVLYCIIFYYILLYYISYHIILYYIILYYHFYDGLEQDCGGSGEYIYKLHWLPYFTGYLAQSCASGDHPG